MKLLLWWDKKLAEFNLELYRSKDTAIRFMIPTGKTQNNILQSFTIASD